MTTTVPHLKFCVRKPFSRIVFTALSLYLISTTAQAQGNHHIHVNGVLMSPAQVTALEQLFGQHIPNGRYWYNPYTDEWGVGDFPSAETGDNYQQATDTTSRNSPYWEDRMSSYGIDVPSTVIYP